jgi:integrase
VAKVLHRRVVHAVVERVRDIGLHFHDLRREAGSRLLEAGMPLNKVQKWLGHASVVMTARYVNVTLDGLDAEIGEVDQFHEQRAERQRQEDADQQAFVHDSSAGAAAEPSERTMQVH